MRLSKDIAALVLIAMLTGCKSAGKLDSEVIKAPVDKVMEEKISGDGSKNTKDNRTKDDAKAKETTEGTAGGEQGEVEAGGEEKQTQVEEENPQADHKQDTSDQDASDQKLKVALFAPANNKDAYKNATDAAQMAIFDFKHKAKIELMIIDSGKPIEELEEEVVDIVGQRVGWVISPQSADATRFIHGFLKNDGITMLSVVSDDDCVTKDRYYHIATSTHDQVSAMLEEWRAKGGRGNSEHGDDEKEGGNNISEKNDANSSSAGDVIVAIMPNDTDIHGKFDKVFYYDNDPKKSMESLSRAIGFIKKLPIYNRLAIVLPEGGWRIKRLMAELRSMPRITIMAAGGNSIAENSTSGVGNSGSDGIWYADIKMSSEFKDGFQKNYGYTPSDLAVYIYDAITLVSHNMADKDFIGGSNFKLEGCSAQRHISIRKVGKK